jgi:ribosomal-protein-alanine N-acetyltransferase
MAEIHAASFPPKEAWGVVAISTLLDLPGTAGWCHPAGGMSLARVAADELEVLTLAVIPAARGKGLGAALVATILDWGAAHGAGAAFLEVAAGNLAAKRLYTRAGFSSAGRRTRYYTDGSDALILRRAITPRAAAATD